MANPLGRQAAIVSYRLGAADGVSVTAGQWIRALRQLGMRVRTVAGGDALLSPSVTRRVIAQFTRHHQQAPPKAVEALTPREMDVFRLITRGLSNAEIGRELFISDTTVKTHVTRLLQKLDLRDRAQAIVLAYQSGLFDD